jgi:hypothetical protein
MEVVPVRAGHEVLMEVDNNMLLIVGDPQGILEKHLKPHPINLLKFEYYLLYKKILNYQTDDHPIWRQKQKSLPFEYPCHGSLTEGPGLVPLASLHKLV